MCHISRRSRSTSAARTVAVSRSVTNDRHADNAIPRTVDSENNATYERNERVSDVTVWCL